MSNALRTSRSTRGTERDPNDTAARKMGTFARLSVSDKNRHVACCASHRLGFAGSRLCAVLKERLALSVRQYWQGPRWSRTWRSHDFFRQSIDSQSQVADHSWSNRQHERRIRSFWDFGCGSYRYSCVLFTSSAAWQNVWATVGGTGPIFGAH